MGQYNFFEVLLIFFKEDEVISYIFRRKQREVVIINDYLRDEVIDLRKQNIKYKEIAEYLEIS